MEDILVPLFLFGAVALLIVGLFMVIIPAVAWVGVGFMAAGLLVGIVAIAMMITY